MQKTLFLSLIVASLVNANSFYNTSSMQGATGVINTPTAEVLDYKLVEIQYSNQVDLNRYRGKRDLYESDQYIFNFGFLPNLELIGRLSNIETKDKSHYTKWHNFTVRDLSASLKYQIPFYNSYLPKVAIGINDLGGQADHYDAKYIVATKDFMFLRGSVGYGVDSINLLDGFFGSLELKVTDFATLLGEYDSKDKQVGIRLNTPNNLSNYFDASLLAKTNLSDDSQKYSFGINIKMPLGNEHNNIDEFFSLNNQTTFNSEADSKIRNLTQSLIDFGFENVDVGENGDAIYVAYENSVLDHNELDAFGVVLGYILRSGVANQNFVIVMKKSGIKVKELKGSISKYKTLLSSPTKESIESFRESIVLSSVDDNDVELYYEGENSSQFKPRLELSPSIVSTVGTEVGVFDYQLSLRSDLSINIYKGVDLTFSYNSPLFNSDNFDKGEVFSRYRTKNKINSILLNRSDVFGNFINVASVGKVGKLYGILNSSTYSYDNHTFSLIVDYLEAKDKKWWEDKKETRTNYLGVYSYYMPEIDTNFRITGGEYYYGDRGYELRMKKFFGDTAISFFYQNSDQNYIGMNIALPLTPRYVPDGYFQLKGKKDFNYGIRSTVQDDDGRNTLETSYLIRIAKQIDTKRTFLNRNRMSEDYVKEHLLRLRDASIEYVFE